VADVGDDGVDDVARPDDATTSSFTGMKSLVAMSTRSSCMTRRRPPVSRTRRELVEGGQAVDVDADALVHELGRGVGCRDVRGGTVLSRSAMAVAASMPSTPNR
jgi:hypothetical protein